MATTEIRRTACSLDCFDACGIVAEVADGRIARIGGDPEHPITRGVFCNKVNHYLHDRFYHPNRQLHGDDVLDKMLRRNAEAFLAGLER